MKSLSFLILSLSDFWFLKVVQLNLKFCVFSIQFINLFIWFSRNYLIEFLNNYTVIRPDLICLDSLGVNLLLLSLSSLKILLHGLICGFALNMLQTLTNLCCELCYNCLLFPVEFLETGILSFQLIYPLPQRHGNLVLFPYAFKVHLLKLVSQFNSFGLQISNFNS